jgi:hypothetical protein
MMTIHWQGNRGAVSATLGLYMIRAWKTSADKTWAWDLWLGLCVIDKSVNHPYKLTTRIAAQRAAEKAMNEHINKQQAEK